jgi:hypothetical protein
MMASDSTLPFPHPRHRPTEAEVGFHQKTITRLETDIKNTQNEINRLQANLVQLQKAKANHASYIAPLRRLPVELLSEIVYMSLESGVKLATLAQICGTLRDVVIGSSTLWNNIVLGSALNNYSSRHEEIFTVSQLYILYEIGVTK